MAGHAFAERYEGGGLVEESVRFVEWELPGRVLSVSYISRHGRKMVVYYRRPDGTIFGLWDDMPLQVRLEADGSAVSEYTIQGRRQSSETRRIGDGRYRTIFREGQSTATRDRIRISREEALKRAAQLYPAEFGTASTSAAPGRAAAVPPVAEPRVAAREPSATTPQPPATADPGGEGRRVALVIGVGEYSGLSRLENAVNDAQAIARALRDQLGFDVELLDDPTATELSEGMTRFSQRMREAGGGATGLFYFAGHGIRTPEGKSLLLPADVTLTSQAMLDRAAVAPEFALELMQEAGASVSILVLDACRNVPLTLGSRVAASGVGSVAPVENTFIAYSTRPGTVAFDGPAGGRSPFAAALLSEIKQSERRRIHEVFEKVRKTVVEATGGQQIPVDESSMIEPLFLPR